MLSKYKLIATFLLILSSIHSAFCATADLNESEVLELFPKVVNIPEFTRYLRTEEAKVEVPFKEHSIKVALVPNTYTAEVSAGYNLNKLTDTQKLFLQRILDKHVLEVGAGQGYFTGKISTAARTVHAVEVSKTAGRLISERTKQYKQYITEGEQAEIFVTIGSILNPKLTLRTYDAISIFNVLHYMAPDQAIETLTKSQVSLNESGEIYIIMNALGCHKPTFNQYLTAKNRGTQYPGYMCFKTEAIFGFDAQFQKELPEIFFHGSEMGDGPMISRTCVIVNQKKKNQSKIHTKSLFYGDRETMLMLLEAANLEPVDIYYETEKGDKILEIELTFDLYEKYNIHNMNICAIARRKVATDALPVADASA